MPLLTMSCYCLNVVRQEADKDARELKLETLVDMWGMVGERLKIVWKHFWGGKNYDRNQPALRALSMGCKNTIGG